MSAPPSPGRLYLVPTPLDHGCDEQAPIEDVLPKSTLTTAASLSDWIVENARSARAFIKRVATVTPLPLPLQQHGITELPRHVHKKGDHGAQGFDARALLQPALSGRNVGLLSEAGMPAVADPGSSVVRTAHELGLVVVPLVGPCSLLLALAASGLNGQSFAFVGYLPQDSAARQSRIRELEALARRSGQTQLFIETPYRNAALLESLVATLAPQTRLAVSSGLTLADAHTRSETVARWRTTPGTPPQAPAVFAIGP